MPKKLNPPNGGTRCATCRHKLAPIINERLLGGESPEKVSAWLDTLGPDHAITGKSIRIHRRDHLDLPAPSGPVETRTTGDLSRKDLAVLTRDLTVARVQSGDLTPTLSEGLRAQEMLDRRAEKDTDRDVALALAAILSGAAVPVAITVSEPPALGPGDDLVDERAADEDVALFRSLLPDGGEPALAPILRPRAR